MRLILVCAFLAFLFTAVAAKIHQHAKFSRTDAVWKEDHEIFDLVSDLEAAEGKGTTFYSWLDIPSTASLTEINKAYRKKSIQLHPDKNPGVKGVHERFARLGVIVNILRSQEGRTRYDFFYKNGVPKWRGTGYYYTRFRPGLGTVLIFLTILTTGMQYVVQSINYKRDLNRIRQTIRDARVAAWGPKMVQLDGKRKVKVNLGGVPRVGEDGRMVPGKVIDMVVDGENVYVLDSSGELYLLDEDTATRPSIARTWFAALVGKILGSLIKNGNRPLSAPAAEDGREMDHEE
ncbi:hypothetical protein ID866_2233, partial [Astraeus odoratus]